MYWNVHMPYYNKNTPFENILRSKDNEIHFMAHMCYIFIRLKTLDIKYTVHTTAMIACNFMNSEIHFIKYNNFNLYIFLQQPCVDC